MNITINVHMIMNRIINVLGLGIGPLAENEVEIAGGDGEERVGLVMEEDDAEQYAHTYMHTRICTYYITLHYITLHCMT